VHTHTHRECVGLRVRETKIKGFGQTTLNLILVRELTKEPNREEDEKNSK